MSVEDEKKKKKLIKVINPGYAINYLFQKIKKMRDHDHVTWKYRGSAYWSYNIIWLKKFL